MVNYLVVVEDYIGVSVSAGYNVGPKFAHEKYLISELWRGTVFGGSGLFDPIGEMADKVEEEVGLWNTYDFIGDLDKQAETLGRFQSKSVGYALTKVLGTRARVDLERLVSVIRKVDLVEDLSGLVLDGFNFHLVRWILSLAVFDCLLEPNRTVWRELVASGSQE